MKISELESTFNIEAWTFIGGGTYNKAYRSNKALTIEGYTSHWVLKQPKTRLNSSNSKHDERCNNPARALRKWNLINPTYPAWLLKNGWIAPCIEDHNHISTSANDTQIADKIIKIYLATGNIIIDACGLNNFLISGNEVICIDVDLAIQQDSDDSKEIISCIVNQPHFKHYLNKSAKDHNFQHTVDVIETLLYLDREACDFQLDKRYVTPELIEKLYKFREERAPLSHHKIYLLWIITQLDPSHEIENADITPDLIRHLEIFQKQQLSITKETLVQLITREKIRQHQPSIPTAFLGLCDSLPTQEHALLNAFGLGFST